MGPSFRDIDAEVLTIPCVFPTRVLEAFKLQGALTAMKTQRKTWMLHTTACVIALWIVSGCANKANVAENEQVDGFSESADAAPSTDAAGDTAQTDAPAGEPGAEAATEAELFGETAATDPGAAPTDTAASTDPAAAEGAMAQTEPAAGDPAMESLFSPNQDPNAAADPNFAELTGTTGDQGAATASLDPNAPPADAAAGVNADPLLAAGAATSPALQDPASPSTDAQAFSGKASFSESKSYAGAVVPKIPDRAVTRKGTPLNRYYFLRRGDTAKSVSELIYGEKSHASSLKKWNKGRWMPGKVIYYPSAVQPDDAQMVSFYDERGLTPEEHSVARGETMSMIAKKKLGSVSSWKEIAVVNGLSRPDSLKRGQTVKLFTNLSGGTPATAVATSPVEAPAPTPTPDIAPMQVPSVPETVAQAPAQMAPIGKDPSMPDPLAEDLSKPKKKAAKQGLNLAKLVGQNSFALAMGTGIGLLLLALMMLNKRKRGGSSADDFSEDAFAAPEKKKRR